jgi:hypothetical protein
MHAVFLACSRRESMFLVLSLGVFEASEYVGFMLYYSSNAG